MENVEKTEQIEQEEMLPPLSSPKRKYILIAALLVGVALVGVALASYFLWYVPRLQAREYVEKSQPLFEMIARQIPTIRENTFLDRNTQYHRREDARKDTILDIEELEAGLADIGRVKKEIEQLVLPRKVIPLNSKLQTYLSGAEQVLSLNLADQIFSKKVIDAYGDDLDREITVYLEMFYSGGERTQFILQTRSVADYAEDALSRINNLKPPENVDPFSYEIRKENIQDTKETLVKLNEYYRLSQHNLVGSEVEGMTERNEVRNERIKAHGRKYIEESKIAQGFQSLEEQAKELEDLYREMGFKASNGESSFQNSVPLSPQTQENNQQTESNIETESPVVSPQPKKFIKFTSTPDEEANLCVGEDFILRWQHSDIKIVNLSFDRGNGLVWNIGDSLANANETGEKNMGVYVWKVGEFLLGTRSEIIGSIIVRDAANQSIRDQSDIFSIITCKG